MDCLHELSASHTHTKAANFLGADIVLWYSNGSEARGAPWCYSFRGEVLVSVIRVPSALERCSFCAWRAVSERSKRLPSVLGVA